MQCHDIQSRLKAAVDNDQEVVAADVRAHLGTCADCRAYGEDLRLSALLRSLPIPAASEQFIERSLEQAWQASQPVTEQRRPAPLYWGVAASLLVAFMLAILVAPWHGGQSPSSVPLDMQVVTMAPHSVRQVNVQLVSGESLPEATITVRLDDNLGLAGYPGTNVLSWQTSIQTGTNQLSLPVELLADQEGRIVIEIQSGDARREMQLSIQPEKVRPKPRLLI